jgi:hypothetical protein
MRTERCGTDFIIRSIVVIFLVVLVIVSTIVALAQSTFAQVAVAAANVRRLNHCPPIDAPGGTTGICGWVFTDSPFRGMYVAGPPGHGTGFDFNSGAVLLNKVAP